MNKGTRVKIVKGQKGVGVAGEIFWIGDNKYGPGKRFGVRGDDGETYWVDAELVEASDEAAPAVEDSGELFQKGDRVAFEVGGREGEGEAFWIGDSRRGGQRLGVRPTDDDEAVWLDARQARRVDSAPGGAQPDMSAPPPLDDGPPPIDDATLEAWANTGDELEDEYEAGDIF